MKLIDKLNNNNGQALFEMIIFLPFLIFLFTIFYTVGNSLSGTINQQKAVRGYYYHLVKGNSYLVSQDDLNTYKDAGVQSIGFFAVGWTETRAETKRIGNCFSFSSILKNSSTEECESTIREPAGEGSSFVRTFTMYGVCGPVFKVLGTPVMDKKFIIEQHAQIEQCALL